MPPLEYVTRTVPVVATGFLSDQISAPIVLPSKPTDFASAEPLKVTVEIVLFMARYPTTTDNTVSPGCTVIENVVVNGSDTDVEDTGAEHVFALVLGAANVGTPVEIIIAMMARRNRGAVFRFTVIVGKSPNFVVKLPGRITSTTGVTEPCGSSSERVLSELVRFHQEVDASSITREWIRSKRRQNLSDKNCFFI